MFATACASLRELAQARKQMRRYELESNVPKTTESRACSAGKVATRLRDSAHALRPEKPAQLAALVSALHCSYSSTCSCSAGRAFVVVGPGHAVSHRGDQLLLREHRRRRSRSAMHGPQARGAVAVRNNCVARLWLWLSRHCPGHVTRPLTGDRRDVGDSGDTSVCCAPFAARGSFADYVPAHPGAQRLQCLMHPHAMLPGAARRPHA